MAVKAIGLTLSVKTAYKTANIVAVLTPLAVFRLLMGNFSSVSRVESVMTISH
jgi:hypothetical protein